MTVDSEGQLIAIIAVVLILMFVGGIVTAFATADWRWLALSVPTGAILVGNARC